MLRPLVSTSRSRAIIEIALIHYSLSRGRVSLSVLGPAALRLLLGKGWNGFE